jgi:formate dehydrogenase maturation protein FdhE
LQALVQAERKHKDLAELLGFYHELYEVQFQAKAELPPPKTRDNLDMRRRLESGLPQLTFDQLSVQAGGFARLVEAITGVLLRHNPNWKAPERQSTAEGLLLEARYIFETWDTLTAAPNQTQPIEEAEDRTGPPALLAVGLALAPYLQHAAETVGPQLDLSLWLRGYCPICGGRPNLALLEAGSGARRLVCSRCNWQWGYARVGCPFCGSSAKQTYYPSPDGSYRLYVCPDCKRYLKTVDLRELHRDVYPAVERLLTVGMDLAAQQGGYRD